jgi:hypothetical protein
MSREVKRVALDFDWPIKKKWSGYLNPFYDHCSNCAACDGSGYSTQAKFLSDQWYGSVTGVAFDPRSTGSTPFPPEHPVIRATAERSVGRNPDFYGAGEAAIAREAKRLAVHFNASWNHHLDAHDVAILVKEGRLRDLTEGGRTPTAHEVNEWSLCGFGHDAINKYLCVKAKCRRLRYPTSCPECKGKGDAWDSPENERAADRWRSTEPPTGDGWQMWETTSEGSPISPVLPTPEELAKWLVDNKASAFGGDTATYDQWLTMVRAGWSMSAVDLNDGRGIVSGVEACA